MTASARWPARYLISAGVGVVAGVVYALLHVITPAPPPLGLLGLAGILIGEAAASAIRRAVQHRRSSGERAEPPPHSSLRTVKVEESDTSEESDDPHTRSPQEGTP